MNIWIEGQIICRSREGIRLASKVEKAGVMIGLQLENSLTERIVEEEQTEIGECCSGLGLRFNYIDFPRFA